MASTSTDDNKHVPANEFLEALLVKSPVVVGIKSPIILIIRNIHEVQVDAANYPRRDEENPLLSVRRLKREGLLNHMACG